MYGRSFGKQCYQCSTLLQFSIVLFLHYSITVQYLATLNYAPKLCHGVKLFDFAHT
jgi:hypothetical protein